MAQRLLFDRVTPALAKMMAEAAFDRSREHPILGGVHAVGMKSQRLRSSHLYTESVISAARRFSDSCAVDPENSDVLRRAAEILPAWVFTALVLTCGCKVGMERVEKAQGWPLRSCKLIVALGLDELARRGVV